MARLAPHQLGGHPVAGPAHRAARGPRHRLHVRQGAHSPPCAPHRLTPSHTAHCSHSPPQPAHHRPPPQAHGAWGNGPAG
eukprot:392023-Prymnesium_polylepis.1